MDGKLLVVAEGRAPDASFRATLEKRLGVRVEYDILSEFWALRAPKTLRHLAYLGAGWRVSRVRRRYRYIVFIQQAIAFYYGFWAALGRGITPAALTPLILRPRSGAWGWIRARVARAFLRSRAIGGFLAFSRADRERYLLRFGPELGAKIHFVRFGGNDPLPSGNRRDEPGARTAREGNEGYFFSCGSSNRDYRTLLRAFDGRGEKLVICCSANSLRGLRIPANVQALKGVRGKAFLDCLRRARAILIPLNDGEYSSGQIALLQAMRLGKPIVATAGGAMRDYADEESVIFVRPGRADDLAAAVERLAADNRLVESLGRAARRAFEAELTAAKFAEHLADILMDIEAAEGRLVSCGPRRSGQSRPDEATQR
jgi:glycosyltransferase involved in cell wall biosynthesis